MRCRITLALVLLLAVATPVGAKERPEPLDARQGIEVGRAAETNSLNGIYVSPVNGNGYVASVGGDEITVHDPNSGRLLDRIGPERGVHAPDDVFLGGDGTIYWTRDPRRLRRDAEARRDDHAAGSGSGGEPDHHVR